MTDAIEIGLFLALAAGVGIAWWRSHRTWRIRRARLAEAQQALFADGFHSFPDQRRTSFVPQEEGLTGLSAAELVVFLTARHYA